MNRLIYDELERVIDSAIRLNLAHRQTLTDDYGLQLGPAHFSQEFGTVHINLGRRVGKSSYILSRLQPGDTLVVHDYNRKQDIMRRYQHSLFGVVILTADEVKRCDKPHAPRYPRSSFVYVDEPTLVFSGSLKPCLLYTALAYDTKQTFVMLGR